MGKIQLLATKDVLFCSAFVEPYEVSRGLPLLRNKIEEKFNASSVTYSGEKICVVLRDIDALEDNSLSDWIVEELVAAFPQLAIEPPTVHDEVVGTLTWDEEYRHYSTKVALMGREVDLILDVPVEPTPVSEIYLARQVIKNWPEWWSRFYPAIIATCLPLYNDDWRTLDESGTGQAIDAMEFMKRLSLTTLKINPDSSFKAHFYSDGMFTEHEIVVKVSPADRIFVHVE